MWKQKVDSARLQVASLLIGVPLLYSLPCVAELENTSKIIWSYWNKESIPLSVQLAQKSWRIHNPDYKICLLTPSSLYTYINKGDLCRKFKKLFPARQADIIRILLLAQYGGIWLDATFFTSVPLDMYWSPMNYDIGGFFADFFTSDHNRPVMENWFIAAPKGSRLVSEWKKEVYRGIDTFSNDGEYIKDLRRSGVDLQKISNPKYLMMHCAFLKVIRHEKYKMKLLSATGENAPFSSLSKVGFQTHKCIGNLLTNTVDPVPHFIKLRGCERNYLEGHWHLFKSNSILERLV